jgi:hypothetical protein
MKPVQEITDDAKEPIKEETCKVEHTITGKKRKRED